MAIGVMPALEMAQESDKVISWRKQEGEIVTKDESLLEIEADKAVMGNRIARREYSHRISSGRKPLLRLRCPQYLRKYQLSQPQPPTLAFASSRRNFATRPRDGALSDRSVAVAKMLD